MRTAFKIVLGVAVVVCLVVPLYCHFLMARRHIEETAAVVEIRIEPTEWTTFTTTTRKSNVTACPAHCFFSPRPKDGPFVLLGILSVRIYKEDRQVRRSLLALQCKQFLFSCSRAWSSC